MVPPAPSEIAPNGAPAPTVPPAATDASVTPTTAPVPSQTPAVPDANAAQITRALAVFVDTAPIGVDAAAARFVDAVLREQLRNLGIDVVPTDALYAQARAMALPFPVPAQGLARLTDALQATQAITCELRGQSGFYTARLRIIGRGETAERVLTVVATQWTLADRMREALLLALRGADGSVVTSASPSLPDPGANQAAMPSNPSPRYYLNTPPRRPVLVHPRPFEFGVESHVAISPSRDSFVNFTIGPRFTWFALDRLGVSGALLYTNLRGRNGRVSNLLPMVGIESGVDLLPSAGLFVPLRAQIGYLPFNGPVLRFAVGIAFNVARNLRLEIDVVQPTIWWVNDNAMVSLDLGAQLLWSFGRSRNARTRSARAQRSTSTNTAQTSPPASSTAESPATTGPEASP
ncbi:MAG: hypothetical protein Q8Q09_16440 [Deltaproteobacteria bacterium]|nr:hypothetical protein [Deltaproteobacteria bacterium]